ncbi:hypothetical protein HELRODRAFT_161435 [Helobdella robusta]|uniref:Fibronectin type-III domain-containing protein n=1 Tax=Helobdella robusta TaxID=6412 RepID=T1ERH0_HELRO|nr:hypothetical protein HELRODRAFT_161435 [Helobdella robusta]ESO02194.1 hypothetical protein HELRODRAFT_161435 [Helobdella robusta]
MFNFETIIPTIFTTSCCLQTCSQVQKNNDDPLTRKNGSLFLTKNQKSMKPLIPDINGTTVVLRNLPQHTNKPGCPIIGYKVRVKQEGAKKPQVREVSGVRNTITLQYMLPNATYHIRLISVQCDGKVKTSKRLTVTIPDPHLSDIGKPAIVNFKGNADSIYLAWEPPNSSIAIRGYIVGYGEGVPDVNWQYLDVTQRNITIRNLKKNTQYLITLRAFHNDNVRGPPAMELINTVKEKGLLPHFSTSS